MLSQWDGQFRRCNITIVQLNEAIDLTDFSMKRTRTCYPSPIPSHFPLNSSSSFFLFNNQCDVVSFTLFVHLRKSPTLTQTACHHRLSSPPRTVPQVDRIESGVGLAIFFFIATSSFAFSLTDPVRLDLKWCMISFTCVPSAFLCFVLSEHGAKWLRCSATGSSVIKTGQICLGIICGVS